MAKITREVLLDLFEKIGIYDMNKILESMGIDVKGKTIDELVYEINKEG